MVAIIIWFFLNSCSKQLAFKANHSLISYNNTLLPLFSPIHFISNLLLYKAGTKLAKSSLSRSQLSGEDKRMWSGGICLRSAARNSSRRGLTLVCDDALWRNSAIENTAFRIIGELLCYHANSGFSQIKTKRLGNEFPVPQTEKRTMKTVGMGSGLSRDVRVLCLTSPLCMDCERFSKVPQRPSWPSTVNLQ